MSRFDERVTVRLTKEQREFIQREQRDPSKYIRELIDADRDTKRTRRTLRKDKESR